jgi:hypothetical protein
MTRRRALWALGPATLGLFVVLALIDRRMQHAGGHGIVSFELAGSRDRAREILADWGAEGRRAARASLWVDYLYLAAYGAFLWLAIRALRDGALRRGWARFARPGGAIALLALVAAACDAAEDAFLLLALGGHGGSAAPTLATAFASVKFACLAVAVVYLLAGLVALGVARRGARTRT